MAVETPPLAVTRSDDATVQIVEFTNSRILDEANIQQIGDTLVSLAEGTDHPKLLLDFANVDHLSSAALGMLINCNKRVKDRNGMLRLCNIRPQIQDVFTITRLDKIFRILPTRPDALASFKTTI